MSDTPRDECGHFISRACPDPDCDGELVREDARYWRCNGLVGRGAKPLEECTYAHWDGKQ